MQSKVPKNIQLRSIERMGHRWASLSWLVESLKPRFLDRAIHFSQDVSWGLLRICWRLESQQEDRNENKMWGVVLVETILSLAVKWELLLHPMNKAAVLHEQYELFARTKPEYIRATAQHRTEHEWWKELLLRLFMWERNIIFWVGEECCGAIKNTAYWICLSYRIGDR